MTISYRFLLRRGTAAALTAANEVPLDGEMVIENDTRKFKFGDGTTAWNSLPYAATGPTLGTGVATFLATPSSANLLAAVTDETGTGALVFGTSPTLVTPALGTPSAIVLTNATNLPISTGVSGMGTGVATALAVNVGSAGAFVTLNGAGGTPSSLTLTNATGLPTAGLANDAVTYAKIQNVSATDKVLGRSTAGAGDVEEITFTPVARTLAAQTTKSAMRSTGLGLGSMATQDDSAVSVTGTLTFSGSGAQPIIQRKAFGYGGSYRALMLGGQSSTAAAIGIDVSTVAGGGFLGDGKEMVVASGFSLTAPNSAGTDWITRLIAVDNGVLSFGSDNFRRLSVTSDGLEPYADNTYYLGRNSSSSPKAFKGLILKDQVSGTYYRLAISSGAITLTAL